MRNRLVREIVLILSFFAFSPFLFSSSQEKVEMTVEWIHRDECRDLTDMPRFIWLSDGSVLLYDTGVPKEERTLERLNLRTAQRMKILDQTKAMNCMKAVSGDKNSP